MIRNLYSMLSTVRLQEIYKNFLICSHYKDPSNKLFNWPTRAKSHTNISAFFDKQEDNVYCQVMCDVRLATFVKI